MVSGRKEAQCSGESSIYKMEDRTMGADIRRSVASRGVERCLDEDVGMSVLAVQWHCFCACFRLPQNQNLKSLLRKFLFTPS